MNECLDNLWKEYQFLELCVDLRKIKRLPSCLNDIKCVELENVLLALRHTAYGFKKSVNFFDHL